tara:strand:- start:659 stop:967 length:309 start_codon:yes stop_codon:yes gene_type:complete
MYNTNSKDADFVSELYSRLRDLESFIKEEGYTDRVMSAIVIGIIEEIEDPELDTASMKALYSYNLTSYEELSTVKKIMDSTYEPSEDDDLGDMLNNMGISLN